MCFTTNNKGGTTQLLCDIYTLDDKYSSTRLGSYRTDECIYRNRCVCTAETASYFLHNLGHVRGAVDLHQGVERQGLHRERGARGGVLREARAVDAVDRLEVSRVVAGTS